MVLFLPLSLSQQKKMDSTSILTFRSPYWLTIIENPHIMAGQNVRTNEKYSSAFSAYRTTQKKDFCFLIFRWLCLFPSFCFRFLFNVCVCIWKAVFYQEDESFEEFAESSDYWGIEVPYKYILKISPKAKFISESWKSIFHDFIIDCKQNHYLLHHQHQQKSTKWIWTSPDFCRERIETDVKHGKWGSLNSDPSDL